MIVIASVVEGHGETRALPALIQRIARAERPDQQVVTPTPSRMSRSRLAAAGELERHVALAAGQVVERGGVLVLFDADDDCPLEIVPALLARAQAVRPGVSVGLVLAMREYESWFLASAASIAGRAGLSTALAAPADSELVRGAKEWLTARMAVGRSYRPTVDQLDLTRLLDLDASRLASPSFDKCYREVVRLLDSERVEA